MHDLDALKLGAYPKAMSVLVALELKPATEVAVAAHNDEPEAVRRALEKAGLKVMERTSDSRFQGATRFIVAKTDEIIAEIATLDPTKEEDARRYGELMGFLPSMIDAYARKIERLPDDEWPEDVRIFEPVLSRGNAEEEVTYLRKWKTALEHYAPKTYEQLIGGARKVGKL